MADTHSVDQRNPTVSFLILYGVWSYLHNNFISQQVRWLVLPCYIYMNVKL